MEGNDDLFGFTARCSGGAYEDFYRRGFTGDLFGPGMREASQKPVSEVMSPIKVTIAGGDSIAKAVFMMIQEHVGMMPVIQDSKVAGMIRLSDLFTEISKLVLGE